MHVQTIGHATLSLFENRDQPLLITDPWLVGSCYWRSWWIQNYPDEATLDQLAKAQYCYITHEHPDHFHPPSLRRLGRSPYYLAADFNANRIVPFLKKQTLRSREIPAWTWMKVTDDVSILSVPCFGNDSILLVDTPTACLININDARPGPLQMSALRRHIEKRAANKKRVVLCSYSSAGIANSCFRKGKRLCLVDRATFVRFPSWLCDYFDADYFMPFASQVIFGRPDSIWANDFKVTYRDIEEYWQAKRTQLLPTYTTLDLTTFDYESVSPSNYLYDRDENQRKAQEQIENEKSCQFDNEDLRQLTIKLRDSTWHSLWAIYPRGVGFKFEGKKMTYLPWLGKIVEGKATGNIVLELPKQALKDVLKTGHMSDLCIPMFTRINVGRLTIAKLAYLFFQLIQLHDIEATSSLRNFLSWLGKNVQEMRRSRSKISEQRLE